MASLQSPVISAKEPQPTSAQEGHRFLGTANLNLPAEECTYTMSRVRIPMSDGIHLAADLYRPAGLPFSTKPHGLMLVLGCYGRGATMSILNARVFAARGYMVLFGSCRGTFGSEGTFIPGMSEQADTQAIVRWMREQSWYPGKFATFGASYLGYTQWALLHNPPEDLVASVILCGPHDLARHNWSNGAYRMDRISWSYAVARLEDQSVQLGPAVSRILTAAEELKSVFEAVPLLDAVERHFEGKAPYIRQFMTVPNIEDPYWSSVRHKNALDRVNIPVLLGSGWYDIFTYQTMEQYERMKDRGCKVNIIIGPWTHTAACGLNSMPEVFDFLDEHVVSRKKDQRPLPVKIFVTGAEEWRQLPAWPPATEPRTFYLHGDKSLSAQLPAADSPDGSFAFDPACPTPTMGGPLLSSGGRVNDSTYASRSDVLVYTSTPMMDEVEVMGRPVVQLTHSSDLPYADLWVRMSEIDVYGVSHNIVETYEVLDVNRERGVVSLKLQECAHLFKTNTRIRMIVAGGSFPLMARNLGTEGNRTMTKEMNSVTHTIQHRNGISKLTLPCLP